MTITESIKNAVGLGSGEYTRPDLLASAAPALSLSTYLYPHHTPFPHLPAHAWIIASTTRTHTHTHVPIFPE